MRRLCFAGLVLVPTAQEPIRFDRVQLSTEFTCEGATFADLDRDGDHDVVAGPWWYEGPDFRKKHAIYEPKTFDPHGYSDNFFAWPRDLDGDAWPDLLVVGFPGKEACWYRNAQEDPARRDVHWERFLVASNVDNESPAFTDLTGDGKPELVFQNGGVFGFAWPNFDAREPWNFTAISEKLDLGPFTHGLGVGDVDGDRKKDVLWKDGWFQQPADPPWLEFPIWRFHRFPFSDREGGAQMFVYDVDGDGDGDVITSLAAHHFGLSWFEQTRAGEEISFVEHRIMDDEASDSAHGVCFAELHALDLADVDGDGLKDIVTGKRWWSHGPQGDPQPGSKPVACWFQLVRREGGHVDFVSHLADDASGVGVQLTTGDVDGDRKLDLVVANKLGAFVLLQRPGEPAAATTENAATPTLDFEDGDLRGWTASGDAFEGQPVRGDTVAARGREVSRHQGECWIGGYEAFGDGRKGKLVSSAFTVEKPWASFLVGGGAYPSTRVEIVLEVGERVVFQSTGANYESLQRVAVDLRPYPGQKIFLRIVDDATGGWGHINFDDFRFHDEAPVIERPAGVPPVAAIDEVAHAGLSPEAARAAMVVPEGFHVDLVAAEPDVHQPIALAIDDRNRLWVAEAFTYPRRKEGEEGLDDLVVFSDADSDGRFEKRTVFLDELNLVSGLEVGFGGVWIGAAPYLLFVPDRDRDLVPDGPTEVVLDGFGYEDTHETLNAFTWGPDGWLYGCHGVFTESRVGAPGTPDEQRTPLDAGVWRFHPTRREFEVFAWGTSNPWGIDFDDRGQAFITACVVPHLWHVIQGARYERQAGNHFDAYAFEEIGTIADHLHWKGFDQWTSNLHSNAYGGGHAHCGAMIYLGGAFPERWRGAVFMNNVHGNRVNVDFLERKGSGFTARHGQDFARAEDRWFRGIALEYGPEGSVYLTDWYDRQACHLSDPEVWDRSNGRIYRVSYGPHRTRKLDLQSLPSSELVGLQMHDNEWYVRHARRILQERGSDPAVCTALRRVMDREEDEGRRLRALWALHAVDGLGDDATTLLRDRQEYVQAWAIQFLAEREDVPRAALQEMERLAGRTNSPVVRLYLAAALQRLPTADRWNIAEKLLARDEDAHDPNLPALLWYGVEPLVAADPERALGLLRDCRIENVARDLARRAAADPALHDALAGALARALARPELAGQRKLLLEATAAGLADQRGLSAPESWRRLLPRIAADPDPSIAHLARTIAIAFGEASLLPSIRRDLADPRADVADRREALDALATARDPQALPAIVALLDDPALRGPALRALAAYDDPNVADAILARYTGFALEERRDALNTLSSRAAWASKLLDAVASDEVARADLGAFVVRKIEGLNDASLAARARELFGRVRSSGEDELARIAAVKALIASAGAPPPDPSRGREVFSRTCEQCHTLFGRGGHVGPDLTGSNRADLDYLLSNVVAPNAVVGKDYLATLAWLDDGRLVTGILKSETDSSITLQSENESVVIARDEIEEMRLSDLSTMPEGLLDGLADVEIRDLVAYVRGPPQVLLRATKLQADRLFDGKSLDGWSGDRTCWSVEGGEIVGRTSGLSRNEFLVSDLDLGDFRLSLDVRLAADQGNSGIQFRSRVVESGEVAGYQADVGPGWWGKLYEENGRGLLSDRSGEAHVVKDGWNRYEIEARGAHVRTWINGQLCVDLEDPAGARRGSIALQLHSGGATEVRFRALWLELLD